MAKIVKTGKKRQKARFNVDIFFMFRCGGVFPGESTINSVSCATRTTPAVFCCVAVWRDDIHSCVEDTAALTEERGPGCCVHCSISARLPDQEKRDGWNTKHELELVSPRTIDRI